MAQIPELIQFRWSDWIKELKIRVMYLYPPPIDLREILDFQAKGVRSRFAKEVQTHTKALLLEQKEPPAAIAAAIHNFADDIAAGREVTVRAGDYIAIQNFMRAKKG